MRKGDIIGGEYRFTTSHIKLQFAVLLTDRRVFTLETSTQSLPVHLYDPELIDAEPIVAV